MVPVAVGDQHPLHIPRLLPGLGGGGDPGENRVPPEAEVGIGKDSRPPHLDQNRTVPYHSDFQLSPPVAPVAPRRIVQENSEEGAPFPMIPSQGHAPFLTLEPPELLGTLRFRNMNREQRERRERYEQRLQRTLLFNPPVEIQTLTLEGSPVFFSQGLNTPFFSSQELLGTLPFLFAIFACFAVRIPANYSGLSL